MRKTNQHKQKFPYSKTCRLNPNPKSRLVLDCGFTLCQRPIRNNLAAAYSKNLKAYVLFSSQRLHLVRPKDTVEPIKQDGVVYRIPCECSKVYIVETGRPTGGRGGLCKIESKNMSETSDLPVPRLPPFQNTLTTPDTTCFGTK